MKTQDKKELDKDNVFQLILNVNSKPVFYKNGYYYDKLPEGGRFEVVVNDRYI